MRGSVACFAAALLYAGCGAGASLARGSSGADQDHDGVADGRDQCPQVPEDIDSDRDEDGCPDGDDRQDSDHDTIIDIVDQCPNDAEDRDAFQDEDGCPDPDNDQDRMLDVDDRCPNDGEVYNGLDDDDGCPDSATVHVMLSGAPVFERIYFRRGSSTVEAASSQILEAMAATIVGNPGFERLGVFGHATRDEPHASALAGDRARAVAQALVARGVERERLSLYTEVVTAPRAEQERARHVQPYVLRAEGQDREAPDLAHATQVPFAP